MLFTVTVMAICGAVTSASANDQATGSNSGLDLQGVKSWGYQLQRLDVQQAARMPHDLLVVDYSKDGSEAGALSWSELSQLKFKPDGSRRIVLAYLSIGEAENYRYYWKPAWQKSPPSWLGRENKNWTGNFLAKYWMPEWQRIILQEESGYLSKIINRGFDGVYLDRIDAYADWQDADKDSRRKMIDFVIKLSRLAKSRAGDFLIFAQNAEELLINPRYIAHIDGIAKEDMLFGALHRSKPNPSSLQASHIKYLKIARKNKKSVLVVEYLPKHFKKRNEAVQKIRSLKFIPYISQRKLDALLLPPE
ncbi:MAG: MJ1477/TM1410 family putative glycoside hydrolase [Hyphomicrobiaceae bacterium]